MEINSAVEEIQNQLINYQNQDKKLCITSSFQSHSLPLLHIVTRTLPSINVLFIDTGFHFPETYAFRNQIVEDWGINLVNLRSKVSKNQQIAANGEFLFANNPEYCCHINKVEPLDDEIEKYNVWIAGLRRDQTEFRETLHQNEILTNGVLKYHPILDWNSKMIYEYAQLHNLPKHPLETKGYLSVGCMPCTTNINTEIARNGRWYGSKKNECGIHLNK